MERIKTYIALLTCAILCIGTVSVGRTSSYFTSQTSASGGYKTSDTRTEPDENVGELSKEIAIKNTGEAECYARVKVICGTAYELQYTFPDGDGPESGASAKWVKGADGYYYYKEILKAGASSTHINAKIVEVPKDFDQKMLNIVVITESVPVIYKAGGPEDWSGVDWSMAAPSWEMEVKQ